MVKVLLPGALLSGGGLLLEGGEESLPFFFSAVKTDERAATAAALCEPFPLPDTLDAVDVFGGDDLKAEVKAARASALCLGPLP